MPRKKIQRGPRRTQDVYVSASDCLTMETGIGRREIGGREYHRLRKLWPLTRYHYASRVDVRWWEFDDDDITLSYPGTRPWAWWEWESPEPRKLVEKEWAQLWRIGALTKIEKQLLADKGLRLKGDN